MDHAAAIEKNWTGPVADTVVLDYEDRHRRRIVLEGRGGLRFLLDLGDVPDLRDGDAIRLVSDQMIAVEAATEALMEVTAPSVLGLMKIAWHIGNRHLPAEISETRLRIRADHVIGHMIEGLGGTVTTLEAPFNPEGGAYGGHVPTHGHDHSHSHAEGHSHG